MSSQLVVVMMCAKLPIGWVRAQLETERIVRLPREEGVKPDKGRDRSLLLVDDTLAPSNEVRVRLKDALGSWERLCVAVHDGAALQPAWIAAFTMLPGDVSIRRFQHALDYDYTYCAIHDALMLHGDGLTPDSSGKFDDALRAIDEILAVDWVLEAKLALLHACFEGAMQAPVFPIHLIPEPGPALRALGTIWEEPVPELVNKVAASTDGAQRQESLRLLRDALLQDG